eukprot:CAMPEP_0197876890 /NCGR_PEP_ID=MMETSP1439-20131203/5751_1 /TAXON_ID=66791 /ORGANISM="Gonyaulax spinifera, Strain CCMP409" /LENGTH=295 /DNA_ID=CAMNT_0043496197 /DNA_START=94 /DNA_END=981 /DNA_ORIENTATION=+
MSAEIVFGIVDAYGFKRSMDEVRIIREILDEDVNRFVAESGIDARAANELKSEPAEIQWSVLQRGPVRSASNPSAALVGRIRDAKRTKLNGGTLAPMAQPGPAINLNDKDLSEVDRFIAENRLDQSAASSLKSEAMDVQKMVMMQGPLTNCFNPSGALMGRIRAARQGQRAYMPGGGAPGGPAALMDAPAGGGAMGDEARRAVERMQGGPAAGLPGMSPQLSLPAPSGAPGGGPGELSDDTRRAIEKLQSSIAHQEGQAGPPPQGPPGGTTQSFANSSDARLQEEALKAIQSMSA